MPARRSWWMLACYGIALLIVGKLWSGPVPPDKPETWVEVATPHFTVLSNDGDRTARRVAQQFEQIRILYSKALSRNLRLDPGIPIVILAAKSEKSLSQMIPEYWAQKGHTHPAGLFLPGPEKNYIALRTDVEGEFPYLTVYHEYVHLIVNLNFQRFPLWLNEGYATFLGSATILPKSGRLGQANESELSVLQQSKLLPLNLLFRVGNDSPYYNEAEKTNIFYAESWALVHYLMTDASRRKDAQLGKYMALVERGDDPVDSAKSAFGDLGQLQKELESYVSRTAYTMFVVELPDLSDSRSFPQRIVPPAEVDATLGEFDVSRMQLEAARPKIEEALRLDPNLAAAQESMGFLLFREGKRTEAQKYFSRAVANDSKSALTYYYDGMLLVSGGADVEDADEAQTALEKAVALKPELAPAWDALASLYVSAPETLDKALTAAKRAVNAMPGEPRYRFNLAVVLLRMRKFDDARAMVEGMAKSADLVFAAQAERFLEQIDRAQEYSSRNGNGPSDLAGNEIVRGAKSKGAETAEIDRPAPVMKRRGMEQSDSPAYPSRDQSGVSPPAAAAPGFANSGFSYSMTGTISAASCTSGPQALITLQAGTIVMRLHAEDLSKIEVKAEVGNAMAAKTSCVQFVGMKARIAYHLASQKPWDGEIQKIDFLNQP